MNPLPNLFLADLGPDLILTPHTVREACLTVRRNRDLWLARLRTRQIAEIIAYSAEQWFEPGNGFRTRALAEGPALLGVSHSTFGRGLDSFLRQLTVENLEGLIAQDLGDSKRLDDFSAGVVELRGGRTALARGPSLLGHITAGNLPVPALQSIVIGLMLRSAQFLKCATGTSLIPRLFAHSLAATEPKLGSCLELAEWPRGSDPLDDAFFYRTFNLGSRAERSAYGIVVPARINGATAGRPPSEFTVAGLAGRPIAASQWVLKIDTANPVNRDVNFDRLKDIVIRFTYTYGNPPELFSGF